MNVEGSNPFLFTNLLLRCKNLNIEHIKDFFERRSSNKQLICWFCGSLVGFTKNYDTKSNTENNPRLVCYQCIKNYDRLPPGCDGCVYHLECQKKKIVWKEIEKTGFACKNTN